MYIWKILGYSSLIWGADLRSKLDENMTQKSTFWQVQVLDFTVVLHRGTSIRNNDYTWDKSCTVPLSSYRNQTIKTILTDLFPQTITHCTTKIAWMFQNTTYK